MWSELQISCPWQMFFLVMSLAGLVWNQNNFLISRLFLFQRPVRNETIWIQKMQFPNLHSKTQDCELFFAVNIYNLQVPQTMLELAVAFSFFESLPWKTACFEECFPSKQTSINPYALIPPLSHTSPSNCPASASSDKPECIYQNTLKCECELAVCRWGWVS